MTSNAQASSSSNILQQTIVNSPAAGNQSSSTSVASASSSPMIQSRSRSSVSTMRTPRTATSPSTARSSMRGWKMFTAKVKTRITPSEEESNSPTASGLANNPQELEEDLYGQTVSSGIHNDIKETIKHLLLRQTVTQDVQLTSRSSTQSYYGIVCP